MRTVQDYVRAVPLADKVSPEEFDRLAGELAGHRQEIVFREKGAFRHGQRIVGCDAIAAALHARNIHSLLARVDHPSHIRTALGLALTGAPEDAEDALEEAHIELNLRRALFTTDSARLTLDGATLTIENDQPASRTLERKLYNTAGREVFCAEALFRILYSRIDRILYAPTAILPVSTQLAMIRDAEANLPDLAARKIDWRTKRKPHFEKEFCVSCGTCFITCLNDAIERAKIETASGEVLERIGVNFEKCRACGLCAELCPGDSHGHKAVVMIRAEIEGSPDMHDVG